MSADRRLVMAVGRGELAATVFVMCPSGTGAVQQYDDVQAVPMDRACSCGATHRFSASDCYMHFQLVRRSEGETAKGLSEGDARYIADSPCADDPALRDALRLAAAEIATLRAWKAEAMESLGRWHQCGETLAKFLPEPHLGEVLPDVLWKRIPEIIRADRSEIATLRAKLARYGLDAPPELP